MQLKILNKFCWKETEPTTSITRRQGSPEEQTTSELDLVCLYLSWKCRTPCREEPDLERAEKNFSF